MGLGAHASIDSLRPSALAVAITPSDTENIPVTNRVHAVGAGTIRVTLAKMGDGTFVGMQIAAGGVLEIQAKRIWATGTTATGIVALYP